MNPFKSLLQLCWISNRSPLDSDRLSGIPIGSPLDISWFFIGYLSDRLWISVGSLVDSYWISFGFLLDLYWIAFGSLLHLHWINIASPVDIIASPLDIFWISVGYLWICITSKGSDTTNLLFKSNPTIPFADSSGRARQSMIHIAQ